MRQFSLFLVLLFCQISFCQIPTGYYNTAEGKSGALLKTALYNIINKHTELSYDALWTAFSSTDKHDDGSVWDVYSNCPFTFSSDQCGNYSSVCDCYNREHSMPKSWFNEETPMYTDLFHMYPTDGKVNGQRANYPFGECASGTSLSTSAMGKLGKSTYSTYTGTVFEPSDEYKGDFARTYFYMVTCYENKVSSWVSDQLAGNSYPALSAWSVSLFLKWNAQDPVSDKEKARNNVIYSKYQGNRNPFIDHPELANYIWGDKSSSAWSSTVSGLNNVQSSSSIKLQIDNNQIRIENPELESYSYQFLDLSGMQISKQTSSSNNLLIDFSSFYSTTYLFVLESKSTKIVRKIIKQ